MVTTRSDIEAADAQAEALRIALRKAEEYARELRRQGVIDEPAKDGAVIRFKLRMPKSYGLSQVYDYAAIRVKGKWFTTGAQSPSAGRRWDSLCKFINEYELVGEIDVLSDGWVDDDDDELLEF